MQLIGAGFGRTGTDSLKEALELLLDGRCYHMKEVLDRPEHLRRWSEFGARGRVGMDWETLLEDYVAGVDWPIANYWRELMEVYPDAKVLLSVREPDSWFDSLQVLVRFTRLVRRLSFIPRMRAMGRMIDTAVWHIFDDVTDRRRCVEVFERHIAEVKAAVPPDRLLVYRVQDGWAPLCAFLNVPIPEEPFPHRNTRRAFRRMARRKLLRNLAGSLRPLLLPLLLLLAALALALLLRAGCEPAAVKPTVELAQLSHGATGPQDRA
ncbi:MAG: sulfotransferase family protein [Myxococcales bacterium]|nr:sulfotransferase family protein [Myxococcales bacterium]